MQKKILIFTSGGGAGHLSATKALQDYLGDTYRIHPVFVFTNVFKKVDPLHIVTAGRFNGEQLYNYLLRKKWYSLINLMYYFGNCYFQLRRRSMIRIARDYLRHEHPDLAISVSPLINGILLEAAQAQNIPFMIIPTDCDTTSFVKGIHNPAYPHFYMTIAFDDPLIHATVATANIRASAIHVVGFPLRKIFLEPKDTAALKQHYQISAQKPVVLLMMGGQGSAGLIHFAQHIALLNDPLHLIICMGKDTSLEPALRKIDFAPGISTTLMGFTEHIADLMAMADIVITKSGSVSFAEGIYLNTPMMLDATTRPLVWERLNHTLLTQHEWGTCITRYKNLEALLARFLEDKPWYAQVKTNLVTMAKKRPDIEIPRLISQILDKGHTQAPQL